jgi:hypothetical protein
MKFSDNYIETKINKVQKINNINNINNEINYKIYEYEERTIIKELIPRNKDLYYVWGRIGNAMLMNYKCNFNNNIIKLKDLCFDIERKIKRGDFDIVILDIKNELLPLLDKLTLEEINIIKQANIIQAGPLYDYRDDNKRFSTPQIFIDLFKLV